MASYTKKAIKCKCCGYKYEADILRGFTATYENVDLDTDPHDPILYKKVIRCPFCGYSTIDLTAEVADKEREAVESEEFRLLLCDDSIDETGKTLLLARFIADKAEKLKERSYYSLLLWFLKKDGSYSDAGNHSRILGETIAYFEEYLSSNADIESAMILIDLLRQAQRFEEANETILSLEPFIADNKHLSEIIMFERDLIEKGDPSAHKLCEVRHEAVI